MSYHQQYGRHIMISKECNNAKKYAYLIWKKLQSTISCTGIIDRLIDIYLFQIVS